MTFRGTPADAPLVSRQSPPTRVHPVSMESIDQRLPDELLQILVDTFAERHDTQSLVSLFPISRAFKAWAEAHAFRKIAIRSDTHARQFALALNGHLRFSRPAPYVVYLWILSSSFDVLGDDDLMESYRIGLARCPNLLHVAAGRYIAFRLSARTEDQPKPPALTRLSILTTPLSVSSPYVPLLDGLASWNRITHLHFTVGQEGIEELPNSILGTHLDQLKSLEHVLIEVTYQRPVNQAIRSDSYYSEMALFTVYHSEHLLRSVLDRERCPKLKQIVVKSNFKQPRFRALLDDFSRQYQDEPRVVVLIEGLQGEDSYADALRADEIKAGIDAWESMRESSLEAVYRIWSSKELVKSQTMLDIYDTQI